MQQSVDLSASETDRVWFERHPGVQERLRRRLPDEPFEGGWVIVLQVLPGARMRIGLELYAEGEPIVELVQPETGERWWVALDGRMVPRSPTTRSAFLAFGGGVAQETVRQLEGVLHGAG